MFGIGTDLVEIDRIKKVISLYPDKFPKKILSDSEYDVYLRHQRKVEYLAGRFAGKEAILKALGTGLRNCSWSDISILNNELGKPEVTLNGNLLQFARQHNYKEIQLSISHTRAYAVAFCIIG